MEARVLARNATMLCDLFLDEVNARSHLKSSVTRLGQTNDTNRYY